MQYEPRCCISRAHSKEIQAQLFLHKSHLLAPRIDCSEVRISTQMFSYEGFRVIQSSIHRVRTHFLPSDPYW